METPHDPVPESDRDLIALEELEDELAALHRELETIEGAPGPVVAPAPPESG